LYWFPQTLSCSAEASIEPTFARDTNVQVPRGGDLQVVLQAVPDYGNPITFQIQRPPVHGALSNLTNDTDHTATVTYHHDGSKMPLVDEFSFRAQAPGHAKSSACKVHITISPPPAHLVFQPKEVDFGGLQLGQKRQTNVLLTNLGGVEAVGRIVLPQGYSAPAGDSFSLNEGESSVLLLEFHPQEEKEYSTTATLLADCEKESLLLNGKGLPRFEITKTGPLSGRVKNLSDQPLRVSFLGPASWAMPREMSIPPHGENSFLFREVEQEEGNPPSAQSSEVEISDGLGSRTFELPPTQGFIPLTVTEEPVNTGTNPGVLGTIGSGSSMSVKFSLINRSENSRNATWIASSSSGGGMPAGVSIELKGGESREMQFDWKPREPGEATLKISVDEGTKTHHELLWKAMVSPSTNDAPSPSTPGDPSVALASESHDPMDQGATSESATAATNAKSITPLGEVSWVRKTSWSGKTSIILKWSAGKGDDPQYSIEEQIMRMTGNQDGDEANPALPGIPAFTIEFHPVNFRREKREGNTEVMRLPGLSAGWHLLVVSRLSKDGSTEAQSKVQVFVPQKRSWWSRWRLPTGCTMILLLIVFLWRQRQW
jgi:hypothetical protein